MPVLSGVTRVLGARGRSSEVPPQLFLGRAVGTLGLKVKCYTLEKLMPKQVGSGDVNEASWA